MMRQRHVSFFAEALADAPGRRSERDASEIISIALNQLILQYREDF